MTSGRLYRIIGARWWLLVIIAVVTVIVATAIVNTRNDDILDREATAGITFRRLLGESDDEALQERLSDANEIAGEVNGSEISTGVDPLAPGVSAEIVAVSKSGRLLFIGRGQSDAAASDLALELRDRYLQTQPLDSSEEIDRRLSDVTNRLDAVVALIDEETRALPLNAAELASRVRIGELQAEISALTARYGFLTVELITPSDPPRPTNVIEGERSAIRRELATAKVELLESEIVGEDPQFEDAEVALLRSEEAQLRLRIDDLVAQRIADEPVGSVDLVETQGTGILPIGVRPIQALAIVLGLLIGIAGLVLLDRSRHPVWTSADVQPRYRLPEIAKRSYPLGDQASHPWYPTAVQGRRKAGVQELRSHVEGLKGFGSGITIGIAALSGRSRDAHELTADLALSTSGSGTRTLLIDTDFGNPTGLVEFRQSGCELESVLADPRGRLTEAASETDGVSVLGIAVGQKTVDSPDVLARPEFAELLGVAKGIFGVVIVACPPSNTAGYHVVTQRLDAMILVSDVGAALPGELENELAMLEDRRARPLGVVLFTTAGKPIDAVVGLISGGASRFREIFVPRYRPQGAEGDTQPSHDDEAPEMDEMPETVATQEEMSGTVATQDGSDTELQDAASRTGIRVDIVSGSGPPLPKPIDDSGSRDTSDESSTDALLLDAAAGGNGHRPGADAPAVVASHEAPATDEHRRVASNATSSVNLTQEASARNPDADDEVAETVDQETVAAVANGRDGEQTDQVGTSSSDASPENGDMNRRQRPLKRDSQGRFIPLDASAEVSAETTPADGQSVDATG
jgi:Mrp family chromosome partitioning ATPase